MKDNMKDIDKVEVLGITVMLFTALLILFLALLEIS